MDYKWNLCEIIRKNKRHLHHLEKLILKKEYTFSNIRRYAGRKVLDINNANKFINNRINSGAPFLIARYGANEMNTISQFIANQKNPNIDFRQDAVELLCKGAGFFPNSVELGEKFVELMIASTKQLDLCGIWDLRGEDYILRKYAPYAKVTYLDNLEPWRACIDKSCHEKPWSSALKGKKILVIHPFDKSIEKQYEKVREHLFEKIDVNQDILPSFQLITMHAVQTINGNKEKNNYRDWFDALDKMIRQCKNIDFDIAIIGCGAYGFPLAAKIKEMGKGAIHLGGATQILFGIMGKRWERDGYADLMSNIINEYWTRPLLEEHVLGEEEVEGGCYW